MTVFRTFSHLNGAEHLVVRKPSLHHEIIGILNECDRSALADGGHRSVDQYHQYLGQKFARRILQLGWFKTSRGFEKERVAMSLCTPSAVESLSLEQIFGSWLWAYSVGIIDVGVKILPVETGRRKRRKTAEKDEFPGSFEGVIGEIKRLGRNSPLVPLLMIGLSLPR